MSFVVARKVVADLVAARGRALLVIGAMAVGLFGVAWVADTNAILQRELARSFQAIDPASAVIRTDPLPDSVLDHLRSVPGVRALDGGRVLSARTDRAHGRRPIILFSVRDYRRITVDRLRPLTGDWPPPDGAVLLERAAVRVAAVSPGDSLAIEVANRPTTWVRVAGTVHDFSQAPAWQEGVIYGYVSRETMACLAGEPGLTTVRLVVAERPLDGSHIREVALRVGAEIERLGYRVTDLEIPPPGEHPHQGQMNALLGLQQALGGVALVESVALMVVLLTAMLVQHRRQIGAMKAIGGTRRALIAMYLLWAFTLALAGLIIALPVAAAAGLAYARFIADLLNFDLVDRSIPLPVTLGLLTLGLVLPLLVAVGPILRSTAMTTLSALADSVTVPDFATRSGRPVFRSRIARLGLLGFGNAIRVRGRFALVVLTLGVGGALFLAAKNVGRSFQETLAVTVAGMGFDVSFGLDGDVAPRAALTSLERVPGVTRVHAASRAKGLLVDSTDARPNAFAVRAAEASLPPRLELQGGRWLTGRDDRTVVANHVWHRDHPRAAIGDSITLTVAGMTGRWRLAGLVRELMTGPALYAPAGALMEIVAGRKHATEVTVSLADHGVDAERRAIDEIDAALAGSGITPTAIGGLQTIRQSREDHILVIVRFLVALAGLAQVVGGLGLATMLSVGVFERSREIGVMRSIGATRAQLLVLVLVEGACIAAAGALAAILLSLPLTWVLGRVFGRMMLATPLDLHFSPPAFAGLGVIAAIIAAAASAIPAWHASRLEPRVLLTSV
jgi:putative ABC transport system permease protein